MQRIIDASLYFPWLLQPECFAGSIHTAAHLSLNLAEQSIMTLPVAWPSITDTGVSEAHAGVMHVPFELNLELVTVDAIQW